MFPVLCQVSFDHAKARKDGIIIPNKLQGEPQPQQLCCSLIAPPLFPAEHCLLGHW